MKSLSLVSAKKKTKSFASLAAASLIWQSLLSPVLSIYAATHPESDPLSLDDDSLWLDQSYSIQVQPSSDNAVMPIMARAAGYVQEVHRIANTSYDLTELVPKWKTSLGIPKLKATLGGIDYTVFCIEPGVIHEKGGNMEAQDYYSQLTDAQKQKIDLILMYGYQNNGDTSDDSYVATQVAIWETVVGNPHYATVWWQLIRGNENRERIYNQLMDNITDHNVKPSFAESTQVLDWNGSSYDKTLTDQNNVLSKYDSIRKNNTLTTKTNRNQLQLSTTIANLNETVELVKQAKYGGLTLYWISNKQNLVSGGQGTPVKTMFTVQTPALGSLTIQKKGPQGEAIEGVSFKVTGPNNYSQTVKTDANGVAVLPEMKGGNYTVTEVEAPAPYLLNTTSQTITLKQGDSASVTFVNEVPTGKVDIYKTGEQLSRVEKVNGGYKFIYEQLPLADTVFDLYAKDTIKDTAGSVIYEKEAHVGRLTTNSQGKASLSNLPLGNYYLKEVQAPAGLVVSTTVHEVNLSYKDASTSVVSASKAVENFRQTVELNLTKVGEQADGSFKPLGNVSFGVYTTQDIKAQGQVVISKGSLVHTLKTKADGTGSANLELPVGSYYVQEIAAPDQYVVSDEKFPFEFTGSSQEALQVKVNVNNGKVITNYLVRARLQLLKNDPNQKALAGATFDLYTQDDLLIGTYTTNQEGLITVDHLIYGDYYLIERQAPNGYRLSDEKIDFSIKKNGETIQLTAVNQPTRVEISKVDIEGQPLAGATLQLLNEKNEVVSEWTSSSDTKVFEQLAHGTYTLKEVAAPSGYQQFEPMVFEVTDKNEIIQISAVDDPTEVHFMKKDPLGNFVEGAHLQLLNEQEEVLTEWMSGTEAMVLTGIPHGNYLLREVSAPSGYVKAEDLSFTVTDTREIQVIEMIDELTQVSIQKVDHLDQPLAGATLQLISLKTSVEDVPVTMLPEEEVTPIEDSETYEVVLDEWFTTGEGRTFQGLTHGTYLIREVGTPLGYQSIPDISFEVTDENKVVELKVVNKPTQLDITKYDEEGNKLFGATMQILDEQGTVLDEWETTDETRTIEGLLPGNYILREITAPDTFKKILDVPFEITNEEKIHVLEVTDELTKTTIHKVDEQGRYISGALLQVINEAGEVVREWETKREPMTLTGLPHGDYTLHEVKAPKGYLLAEDIKFAVTDSHEDLELTMIDAFDPDLGELPQTGFGVIQTVIFATLGVAATIGAVYWMKRHHN